jgi:hypothetical protein
MNGFADSFVWVVGALAGISIICLSGLKAWRGWLDLRREELAAERSAQVPGPETGPRIEMADVRERLRKLEAIAKGVDL